MSPVDIAAIACGFVTVGGAIIAIVMAIVARAKKDFQLDAMGHRIDALDAKIDHKTNNARAEIQAVAHAVDVLRNDLVNITVRLERVATKLEDQS